MRGDVLRGRLGVAGDRLVLHFDAGREHQLVVGKRLAAGERDDLLGRIDRRGTVVDHFDAGFGEIAVAVVEARIGAEAAEIEVREERRRIGAVGLRPA